MLLPLVDYQSDDRSPRIFHDCRTFLTILSPATTAVQAA